MEVPHFLDILHWKKTSKFSKWCSLSKKKLKYLKEKKQKERYKVVGGVLFYNIKRKKKTLKIDDKNKHKSINELKEEKLYEVVEERIDGWREVVKKDDLQSMLEKQAKEYGSPGYVKLHNVIKTIFWWPSMVKDIRLFIKMHPLYQIQNTSQEPPLITSIISNGVFDHIQMDTTYMINENGYRYIVVIIDHFSKYMYAKATKKRDADSICEVFSSFLEDLKITKLNKIHTDNGLEFVNQRLLDIIKSKGGTHVTGVPNNPQCQGGVERANGTLKRGIFNLRYYENKPWNELLNSAVNNYNNLIHSSTSFSPMESINTLWRNIILENDSNAMKENQLLMITKIEETMKKQAIRNERKRLKKSKVDFEIGNMVMIKRLKKKINTKFLESSWPFKGIVMEINKWNVKVKYIDGKGEENGKLIEWVKKHRAKKYFTTPQEEADLLKNVETPTVIKSRKNRKRKAFQQ